MKLPVLQKFSEELSTFLELKLISFIVWTVFYIKVQTKYPNKSPEWATRVVTFVHGSVASLCGLVLCGWPKCIDCFFTRIGVFHYMLMIFSWGYFAFDLLWCLLYWPSHITMLGHHVCTLIAISVYMNKTFSGCVFPCTMALMEVTNPFLQARWFLRDEGLDKTYIFFFIELTYLLLFVFLRGVLGTYIVLNVMNNPKFDAGEKMLTLGLYAISIAFLKEILGYVWYKYKRRIVSVFNTNNSMLWSSTYQTQKYARISRIGDRQGYNPKLQNRIKIQ